MDKTTQKFIDWIFDNLDKAAGKTQVGLAAKLGVAHPQISMLKAGKRDLKVREVPLIAEYLKKAPPSWDVRFSGSEDSERDLRAALLAYGVDREDLARAISAVRVFVDDLDEQSSPDPLEDQSAPSNRRRAPTP